MEFSTRSMHNLIGNQTSKRVSKNAAHQLGEQLQQYAAQLLDHFTEHHQLVYQAIQELAQEQDTVQAGDVYTRYQELCQSYDEEPLTDRRISDYIKTLELLNLIQAEYHYGGKTGKTRKIKTNQPTG